MRKYYFTGTKWDGTMSISVKLDDLEKGLPTLTNRNGSQLAEMALYCLKRKPHDSGVTTIAVDGTEAECKIAWELALDGRSSGSYGDLEEATEYGATALAILYSLKLTGQNTVQRSAKGDGFDYWVGDYKDSDDPPFQHFARLEISGLMTANQAQVKRRFREKRQQISISDHMMTPRIVFIMEFSAPMSAVEYLR
jgi:hypothetical protein